MQVYYQVKKALSELSAFFHWNLSQSHNAVEISYFWEQISI